MCFRRVWSKTHSTVDKRPYPWRVNVKGKRQIVGEEGSGEAFELDMELVRASREEHLAGLLVWGLRAKGDPKFRFPQGMGVGMGTAGRRICHHAGPDLPRAA